VGGGAEIAKTIGCLIQRGGSPNGPIKRAGREQTTTVNVKDDEKVGKWEKGTPQNGIEKIKRRSGSNFG